MSSRSVNVPEHIRTRKSDERRTDGALIAERVVAVQLRRVALLASPDEVDPMRQVLADVVALQCLRYAREPHLADAGGASNIPAG